MTAVEEQIKALTTVEKLQAMEAIWENLSQNYEDLAPPEWHDAILIERRELIENGEAKYIDWTEAKKQLQARIS